MDKKTYETPKLVDLGTVADLTLVGMTNGGGDFKGGSVNPAGHNNNKFR